MKETAASWWTADWESWTDEGEEAVAIDSGESLRDLRRGLARSRRDRSFFPPRGLRRVHSGWCWLLVLADGPNRELWYHNAGTTSCTTLVSRQLRTGPYVSGGLVFLFFFSSSSEGFTGGRLNFWSASSFLRAEAQRSFSSDSVLWVWGRLLAKYWSIVFMYVCVYVCIFHLI